MSAVTVRWVVFDLGGVVLRLTTALPDLAALIGMPQADAGGGGPSADRERFAIAYDTGRAAYDASSDAAVYWSGVAAACGAPRPGPETVRALTTADEHGWSDPDPRTLALIADLDRSGVPLAVLSNMPSSMGRRVRSAAWAGPFRHFVISGDLGVAKPDPRIYRALLEELGSGADGVVFTDDKAPNVAAAARCGLTAIRFTGASDLRADLQRLGVGV